MSPLLALLIGLGQGLLHAAGPDHCTAIVALGARRRRSAMATAIRFALSHTVVLGSVSAACLLAGFALGEAFERWAEIGSGAVLVGLAAAALLFPAHLRHGHAHLGGHGSDHVHPRLPLAAGALMALSGVRSLLLAVPPLVVGGSSQLGGAAWAYLPGFGLGVFLGMGAMGLVIAEGLRRAGDRLAHTIERGAAVASAVCGVAWIAIRL